MVTERGRSGAWLVFRDEDGMFHFQNIDFEPLVGCPT